MFHSRGASPRHEDVFPGDECFLQDPLPGIDVCRVWQGIVLGTPPFKSTGYTKESILPVDGEPLDTQHDYESRIRDSAPQCDSIE